MYCICTKYIQQGRVAIVVVPWSAPLFMERSLTQQFGQQERSNFFWIGQGCVAIVVVPWIDPLFMERSLTQHFGPQERSNFFGLV